MPPGLLPSGQSREVTHPSAWFSQPCTHTYVPRVHPPHAHSHTGLPKQGEVHHGPRSERLPLHQGPLCSPAPPHQVDGRAVSWEAHLFRHKCPGFRPSYPHADCGTEGASAARCAEGARFSRMSPTLFGARVCPHLSPRTIFSKCKPDQPRTPPHPAQLKGLSWASEPPGIKTRVPSGSITPHSPPPGPGPLASVWSVTSAGSSPTHASQRHTPVPPAPSHHSSPQCCGHLRIPCARTLLCPTWRPPASQRGCSELRVV